MKNESHHFRCMSVVFALADSCGLITIFSFAVRADVSEEGNGGMSRGCLL